MSSATDTFLSLMSATIGVTVAHIAAKSSAKAEFDRKIVDATKEKLPELELYDDPEDAAVAAAELTAFEAKLRARKSSSGKIASSHSLGWSKDAERYAEELKLAKTLGKPVEPLTSTAYVLSYFTQLQLSNLSITALDEGFARFSRLAQLVISGNSLVTLQHLPSSLDSLCAYANEISVIDTRTCAKLRTRHVGLGYNRLTDGQLTNLIVAFPNVIVLDLAFNALGNLDFVLSKLDLCPLLEHLVLFGNPLATSYGYRAAVLAALPRLKTLDDIVIPAADAVDEGSAPQVDETSVGNVVIAVRLFDLSGVVIPSDVGAPAEVAAPETKSPPGKAAPAKKGGKEEPPPPAEVTPAVVIDPAQPSLRVSITLPSGLIHNTKAIPLGKAAHALDEAETAVLTQPTLDLRDSLLFTKAVVSVHEHPGVPADGSVAPEPILLAKASVSLTDLLQPSNAPRVSIQSELTLEVSELPSDTLAALRQTVVKRVLAASQPPEDVAAKKPAAKGKAAIVEEAPPRELTADELVTVEKEVKAARKSAITAAVMSVRASVGLVFAGQLPLAATAST